MLTRILVLVEDLPLGRRLRSLLDREDVLVSLARRRGEMWEHLARENYDLLVASRSALPEPVTDLVSTLRKLPDHPEVVILQDQEDPTERAELLSGGCLAVVSARLPEPILAQTLAAMVDRRREAELSQLRAERSQQQFRLSDFASLSPAMQRLLALVRRVVASDSSLLILGETGVGKEWLARAIHDEGLRAAAPFIAVNCAAVPDTLLESELFGHEKGAFTGATRSRRGHFELAHRGTVFLDEIADMTPHLQAKLLRVLQERKIQRLGAEEPIAIDVRVMAATNRDLEQAMKSGAFRRDLYYRLSVVAVTIPPLRQRTEDIPALVHGYLERFSRLLNRPIEGVESDALEALVRYSWPGNVRELINVVERSVLLAQSSTVASTDLPEEIVRGQQGTEAHGPVHPGRDGFVLRLDGWLNRPLSEARARLDDQFERAYLSEHLRRTGGHIGETARSSGLSPRGLYAKMRRHGLRKEDFRN